MLPTISGCFSSYSNVFLMNYIMMEEAFELFCTFEVWRQDLGTSVSLLSSSHPKVLVTVETRRPHLLCIVRHFPFRECNHCNPWQFSILVGTYYMVVAPDWSAHSVCHALLCVITDGAGRMLLCSQWVPHPALCDYWQSREVTVQHASCSTVLLSLCHLQVALCYVDLNEAGDNIVTFHRLQALLTI